MLEGSTGLQYAQSPALQNKHALGMDGVQVQGDVNATMDGLERTVQNVALIGMEQILAALTAMRLEHVLGMEGVADSIMEHVHVLVRFLG